MTFAKATCHCLGLGFAYCVSSLVFQLRQWAPRRRPSKQSRPLSNRWLKNQFIHKTPSAARACRLRHHHAILHNVIARGVNLEYQVVTVFLRRNVRRDDGFRAEEIGALKRVSVSVHKCSWWAIPAPGVGAGWDGTVDATVKQSLSIAEECSVVQRPMRSTVLP